MDSNKIIRGNITKVMLKLNISSIVMLCVVKSFTEDEILSFSLKLRQCLELNRMILLSKGSFFNNRGIFVKLTGYL